MDNMTPPEVLDTRSDGQVMMDSISAVPPNTPAMPTQATNKGTKTGLRSVLAGMLQNFSYGAGQAMKKEAGLPTDADIAEQNAKQAFMNAQTKLMQQQAQNASNRVPFDTGNGVIYLPEKAAVELFKERLKGMAGVEKQQVANEGAKTVATINQGTPMTVDPVIAQLAGEPNLAGQQVGKATLDNINKKLTAMGYKQQDLGNEGLWLIDRGGNRIRRIGDSPAVDRARAYALNRVVKVADPNDPSVVRYALAGDAVGSHLMADSSGQAAAARAVDKYFTSGKGSQTLNAFNTAQMHMATLRELSAALNNGDVQAINRVSQEYAKQTGSPAPTNFDAARAAVAGEVAAAFKSSGATDTEIEEVTAPITKSSSFPQLIGVVQTFDDLLQGKRKALQGQYESGRQGKPAFPKGQGNQPKATHRWNPATGKVEAIGGN